MLPSAEVPRLRSPAQTRSTSPPCCSLPHRGFTPNKPSHGFPHTGIPTVEALALLITGTYCIVFDGFDNAFLMNCYHLKSGTSIYQNIWKLGTPSPFQQLCSAKQVNE